MYRGRPAKRARKPAQPKQSTTANYIEPEFSKVIRAVLALPAPVPAWEKVIEYAACMYCGQVRDIFKDGFDDIGAAERYVTSLCDCPAAKAERDSLRRKLEAQERLEELLIRAGEEIEDLFAEHGDDGVTIQGKEPLPDPLLEFLHNRAKLVLTAKAKAVTIDFGDGIKFKAARSAKDKLQIERGDTDKTKREV